MPWIFAGVISAICGVALGVSVGCSDTTATTGVIQYGITIPAATLTSGLGCGTGPGQVYKYAAAVEDPAAGAIYDCYASAAFQNLVAQADGGDNYTIAVFMYDQATYNANAAQINAVVDAPGGAAALAKIASSYQTVCTGTQTLDLQSVAQCNPIIIGPGSLQITTNSFALADGGSLACGNGYNFVLEGPFDGGGASVADAGPYAVCPAPITVGPFTAHTQVTAPVTLFQTNTVIGTTTCRGNIVPNNAASPATCDPLVLP
jgi:hypothetical protein